MKYVTSNHFLNILEIISELLGSISTTLLRTAFMLADPKSSTRQSSHQQKKVDQLVVLLYCKVDLRFMLCAQV